MSKPALVPLRDLLVRKRSRGPSSLGGRNAGKGLTTREILNDHGTCLATAIEAYLSTAPDMELLLKAIDEFGRSPCAESACH